MSEVYSSGISPNPDSAVDVLAFVFCPLTAFAPAGDEEELAAVAEMIGPVKEEAIQRWIESDKARKRN
jgi:hypothetical protein